MRWNREETKQRDVKNETGREGNKAYLIQDTSDLDSQASIPRAVIASLHLKTSTVAAEALRMLLMKLAI